MATSAMTGGTMPVEVPAPGVPPAAPGAAPPAAAPPAVAPPAEDERRRRRRRAILIAILATLVALLAIIAIWYLIFRKPLPFPIPPVPTDEAPAYASAIYEVTKPLSVAVSADGARIYVTQADGSQETLLLDASGRRLGVLKPPPTIAEHATQLYLAIDPVTSKVFATDRLAGEVYVYSADGSFERRFDPGSAVHGWQPLAIAFDGHGNLFVSDVGGTSQLIHEFDRAGRLVRDFGPSGGLNFPNGIAIDRAGNIYVTDTNDGRLLIFDPSGKQLGLVSRGPAEGELGLPVGVAIDDRDRVFVVDSVAHSVRIFRVLASGARTPAYLTSFGREGTVDGAFEFPNGIALDARGHVYVADWNNDRIQVWSY
jgi:DNA-binding beta-propeller fold protein YncE